MNLSICLDFARVKAAKVEQEHSKTENSFFIFFPLPVLPFLLVIHYFVFHLEKKSDKKYSYIFILT